jgi:hypothetical protein
MFVKYLKRFEIQNRLEHFVSLAKVGTAQNVDLLISGLNETADIPTTKVIDFCLGLVVKDEGIDRIEHYLFNGTQMQRNYCTLFFARRNDWNIVNKAYKMGLIDYLQAYSR